MAIGSLAGSGSDRVVVHHTGEQASRTVRILQLNLCNSGIARCYTGRSVAAAAAVIHAQRPDIVTLNEVCRGDVSVLDHALSAVSPDRLVASAFRAAVDRRAGDAFRCRTGDAYGIGVVARIPNSSSAHRSYSAVYPIQDTRDPEERVWLCLRRDTAAYACTTHLASTSSTVALAQCRYLLDAELPTVRTHESDEIVVGADLNLHSREAQSCLPPDYVRVGDGGVQHILATPGFTVASASAISLHGTTDHPALLVDLGVR